MKEPIINIMKKDFLWVFSLLLILASLALGSESIDADNPFQLEGIMYDGLRPERSLVIVKGSVYQIGDIINDHQIIRIEKERVLLKDRHTQSEKILLMPEKFSSSALSASKEPSEAFPTSAGELAGRHAPQQPLSGPADVIRAAKELSAIAELKKIRLAIVRYKLENNVEPSTLQMLIENGYLDEDSKESDDNYRYTLKPDPKGVQVAAVPKNPVTSLRQFLIDGHGIFYVTDRMGKPTQKVKDYNDPGEESPLNEAIE